MKFPIGTRFSWEPFNYEVVAYNSELNEPYYIKLWDDDITDFETIQMTENEVEASIKRSNTQPFAN